MIYNIYLNIIVKVFTLKSYTLIGPIGSGKTEVNKILQNLNIKCFCADDIVRNLYKKKDVIYELKNIFPTIVKDDNINTTEIREIIFTNFEKMREIENYMHPKVALEFEKIKKNYTNEKIIFFIIPIMRDSIFIDKNKTIYIDSKKSLRIERLKKRKDYNEEIIKKIINYQSSVDIYKNNSSFFIENNSTINNLELSVNKVLKKL